MLTHNRVSLALHHLRDGDGQPLLLLHGLGEAAPDDVPSWVDSWPGPIAALDFTGHGASTIPIGGGYTAEILLADADTALAELGRATVFGRGLGAYIALQLAGSRPADVLGASSPTVRAWPAGRRSRRRRASSPSRRRTARRTPYALVEMSRDLRPPDYAAAFVRLALAGSPLDEPISVAAVFHPPWLEAVAAEPGVSVDHDRRRPRPLRRRLIPTGSDVLGRCHAGARLRRTGRPPRHRLHRVRPIVLALLAFAAMEPVTAADPPVRDARCRDPPPPQPPPPHPRRAGSATTPSR